MGADESAEPAPESSEKPDSPSAGTPAEGTSANKSDADESGAGTSSADASGADEPGPNGPTEIAVAIEPVEGQAAERSAPRPRRRSRWRNRALIAGAVVLSLLGAGLVAGTYYYDSVDLGDPLTFPETTTVYYADGTVLARLGSAYRTPVRYEAMSPAVIDAIIAAEDPRFWTNTAGPITRSLVRLTYDLSDSSASARVRVGVAALKIENEISKEEILGSYLNAVPFGRNTYGIEAAADAYFGKSAKRSAPPPMQLNDAEAMALVAMVRQPEVDPEHPDEFPGYDPTRGAKAKENAVSRWSSIREQMVTLNKSNPGRYLTPEENAAIQFPPDGTWKPYVPNAMGAGREKPAGLVVNHVLDELSHGEGFLKGKSWESIESSGYSIYTTLDPRAQKIAEETADGRVAGSVMEGQPANLQAAVVAVEPGTGRVLAYYGGDDGVGMDYGGFYFDENKEAVGIGRFPPGTSFFPYTLAAGLKAGISLKSYWQWTEHQQPGRPKENPIRNASRCPVDTAGACTLLESTRGSLNVPFYDVTVAVTPAKVLELARDAGIDYMWTDDRERQDLRTLPDMKTMTPGKFDIIVGLGQYPVSVIDHANAMATFAAQGLRAKAHFVQKVMKDDHEILTEKLPSSNQPRVFSPSVSADLTFALNQGDLLPGMESAGHTGTWEYNNRSDQNAHAWMIGYTSSLATAVYVGNRTQEQALLDKNQATIWGSGLPTQVYRGFMIKAHQTMALKPQPFAPPAFLGDVNPPGSVTR